MERRTTGGTHNKFMIIIIYLYLYSAAKVRKGQNRTKQNDIQVNLQDKK